MKRDSLTFFERVFATTTGFGLGSMIVSVIKADALAARQALVVTLAAAAVFALLAWKNSR